MHQLLRDFEQFSQSWWPYLFSVLISMITAIRIYFGGTYCNSSARIDGKVVIITGGSRGIGLETAKELAKRGGKIILAVRNIEKGLKAMECIKKKTKDAFVDLKVIDLSDFASIRNFVQEIKKDYDRVDILINNAGIIAHPLNKNFENNDLTFVTNYLGPCLLTHLMLPLLSKSHNGRVINVSASAHFNGKISLDHLNVQKGFGVKDSFAASKLALTILTKHMARLYEDTSITFNSANPGIVRGTGHLETYSSIGRSLIAKVSMWPWIWLFLKSPHQGCQTLVYLAVEPTLYRISGYFFSECEITEPADLVNDETLAKALYKKSCVVVDIIPDEIILSTPSACATEDTSEAKD